MKLRFKHALVVGLGVSGLESAAKLHDMGLQVTVTDNADSAVLRAKASQLLEIGVAVRLGDEDQRISEGCDLMVVSPGVPKAAPVFAQAREMGIPVWSEIELAWHFVKGPLVAVTGTNGKTTTVTLITEMLNHAGKTAREAGNIGTPLVKAAEEALPGEILVVEVSSFQLENIVEFRPDISVLLNITEDHYDWHPDMADYSAAKARVFANQAPQDYFVCNMDDVACAAMAEQAPCQVAFYSKSDDLRAATFTRDGRILSYLAPQRELEAPHPPIDLGPVDALKLKGGHNLENCMAAVSVALLMGVPDSSARETLAGFEGLEHRMEAVADLRGVSFYNDSKATNPDATVRAVESFPQPLVVIMGGRNKGLSFHDVGKVLQAKADDGSLRGCVLMGEAGEEIMQQFLEAGYNLKCMMAGVMEEAVERATELAQPGDVVLLSPACASFDAYGSYSERGRHFKKIVRSLTWESDGGG